MAVQYRLGSGGIAASSSRASEINNNGDRDTLPDHKNSASYSSDYVPAVTVVRAFPMAYATPAPMPFSLGHGGQGYHAGQLLSHGHYNLNPFTQTLGALQGEAEVMPTEITQGVIL